MPIDRRELVRLLGAAGVGLSGVDDLLRLLGQSPSLAARFSADTYRTLQRGGFLPFGGLFLTPQALADTADNATCFVTIKVMNLMHSPLCFKMPSYTGSNTLNYSAAWTPRFTNAMVLKALMDKGLDDPSDIPRFAKLKMNRWFSTILNTGLDETGARVSALDDGDIGPFPDEVAVQAALHLNQNNTTLNHSFKNTGLQDSQTVGRGGDINYHLAQAGLVRSPLGITALSMALNGVETTDGLEGVNNLVLANNLLTVVAEGRSVDKYVNLLSQTVGGGFTDDGLVGKFDSLTTGDQTLRKALNSARPNIQAAMDNLMRTGKAGDLVHDMKAIIGANAIQALVPNPSDPNAPTTQPAKCEFLSQCLFVKRALDIPGKPMRNFSLLLSHFDLDGASLDTTVSQSGKQPFSYVEAMRQLAMGLNILAQVIKKHTNVYVTVITEGGRSFNMGDNKVAHAFLLGPAAKGRLKDYLYCDQKAVNDPTDTFCADPNEGNATATNSPGLTTGGAGLRKYSDGSLRNESGNSVDAFVTTGAFLNGIVRYLASLDGSDSNTSGLGNFVQIQTG